MFGKLINNWHAARGDILRKEVEDAILRLNGMGPEINMHACLTMADAYRFLLERYGSITNMTNQGQKLTAKMLSKKARGKFHFNVGQGYGLFLLSAYVEAHALPGKDVAFVKNTMCSMLQAALETAANFDEAKKAEMTAETKGKLR